MADRNAGREAVDARIRTLERELAEARAGHAAGNSAWLADLAEARAEVAALREVAALVREWQAAKRDLRAAVNVHGENSYAWHTVTRVVLEIESRLLAAALPEVVK